MTSERRRSTRRRPATGEPLSWARLRTGTELEVVEISNHGALIATRTRLLPGTHVDLHLMTTAGRVLRRARISRALVGDLDASALTYHVALAFDAPVDTSPPRVAPTRKPRPEGELTTRTPEVPPAIVPNVSRAAQIDG